MKVLIIGAKGFIGSHLTEYLSNVKNCTVSGVDVVGESSAPDYHCVSVCAPDYLSVLQSDQFDLCVNCSGAASVPKSLEDPELDFELNTANVGRMLNAIRLTQADCRFINLSSAAVYGEPERLPIYESQASHPLSPYGHHKLMSEQLCREYAESFGLKTCSLRPFSVYGEGIRKQLFWDLHQKSLSGEEISLYGTGRESRDFIHVEDLVRAVYFVAQSTAFAGESINVANGEEIFISEVVGWFYQNYPYTVDYKFRGEGREGDPINWVADISIIKECGYKPQVDIKEGLRRYYKWVVEESV